MREIVNAIYKCSHIFAETHYAEFNELLSKMELVVQRRNSYEAKKQKEKEEKLKKDSSYYLIQHREERHIFTGYHLILEKFTKLLIEVNQKIDQENKEFRIMLEGNITWEEKTEQYTLLYNHKPVPVKILKVEKGYTQGPGYSIYFKGKERGKETELEKAKIKASRIFWEEIADLLLKNLGD